ncbi:MAG TPA: hypothetical protein VHT03_10660 [Rhizomicrobium sp.]|jgi:hypothetical protein|nr:hypothetical protein [Rhizomicrobium sp.]
MSDILKILVTDFGGFDGFSFAMMAIILVGAAFMMPSMGAIVTATCGALFVFGFSVFFRSVLAAKDGHAVARDDWNTALTLPLGTLVVYASVFCFAIAIIHGIRTLSKPQ